MMRVKISRSKTRWFVLLDGKVAAQFEKSLFHALSGPKSIASGF